MSSKNENVRWMSGIYPNS